MRSLFLLLITTALLTASCGPKLNPNEIRIGEYAALTGAQGTFGQSNHEGLMLAVSEINAAGGINGKQLVVTTLDDQGKPEEAAVAVTKLLTEDASQVIVGEVASSAFAGGGAHLPDQQDPHDLALFHQPQGHPGGGLYFPGLLYRPLPGPGHG